VNQVVRVKLLSTDEKGRMRLSIKAAKAEEGDVPAAAPQAPGAGDAASQQQQQQQQ
jgi:polyribonucleotide nucleotidyltransferase